MTRRVVVVEDRAHVRVGHFPTAAASLTAGFATLGCDAVLLAPQGWWGESADAPAPFRVEGTTDRIAALLRFGNRRFYSGSAGTTGSARLTRAVGALARDVGLALVVRRVVREDPETEVVMFAYVARPIIAAALDGPGRIVHHATRPAPGPKPGSPVGFVLDRMARRAEARRRRRGGAFQIAAGNDAILDSWRVRAPFLRPVPLRHASVLSEATVADARADLGIDPGAKVALVFGTLHGGKDLDLIWQAFAELPDWTLLVVGRVSDSYDAWRAGHDGPVAITRSGFVDAATRASAFSAADVAVLSFVEGHGGDSAVLLDALAFGVPVVCTEGTRAAQDVVAHGIGVCFPPGDANALAAAVRSAPATLEPAAVTAALAATSGTAVARAHLDVFDAMGPRPSPGAGDQAGRK